MVFPSHKGELSLVHNAHKTIYQTVEQWVATEELFGPLNWVSAVERQLAIDADSVWVLQWYPESPVGFYRLIASSLPALLIAARLKEAR